MANNKPAGPIKNGESASPARRDLLALLLGVLVLIATLAAAVYTVLYDTSSFRYLTLAVVVVAGVLVFARLSGLWRR